MSKEKVEEDLRTYNSRAWRTSNKTKTVLNKLSKAQTHEQILTAYLDGIDELDEGDKLKPVLVKRMTQAGRDMLETRKIPTKDELRRKEKGLELMHKETDEIRKRAAAMRELNKGLAEQNMHMEKYNQLTHESTTNSKEETTTSAEVSFPMGSGMGSGKITRTVKTDNHLELKPNVNYLEQKSNGSRSSYVSTPSLLTYLDRKYFPTIQSIESRKRLTQETELTKNSSNIPLVKHNNIS